MNRYEVLKSKADKCTVNAYKASSKWAFKYWSKAAKQLEAEAQQQIIKK